MKPAALTKKQQELLNRAAALGGRCGLNGRGDHAAARALAEHGLGDAMSWAFTINAAGQAARLAAAAANDKESTECSPRSSTG